MIIGWEHRNMRNIKLFAARRSSSRPRAERPTQTQVSLSGLQRVIRLGAWSANPEGLTLERPKCIRSGRIILDDLASHRSRVRKWEKESLSLKWAWTRRRARLALQVLRTVVGVVAVFHPASIQKKHSVPRGISSCAIQKKH